MPGKIPSLLISLIPGILAILGATTLDIAELLGKTGSNATVVEWPFHCTFVLLWKVGIGIAGIIFSLWAANRQQYRPFKDFADLRSKTFGRIFGPEMAKFRKEKVSKDLRFSVMRANHWLKLGNHVLIGRLVPVYHFDGENARVDRTLTYRFVKIFGFRWSRGACGEAYLTDDVQVVRLDEESRAYYRLTEHMSKHTKDLSAVVSIPIHQIRGTGHNRTARCVGVMNLDSCTPAFAHAVIEGSDNMHYAKTLVTYFSDCGIYVGMWL